MLKMGGYRRGKTEGDVDYLIKLLNLGLCPESVEIRVADNVETSSSY